MFGAYSRFARARCPHLSHYNRTLNVQIKLHRGICSSPLLRLAGEPRPIGGFIEQAAKQVSGAGRLCAGEDLETTGSADSEVLALILSSIAELDANVSNNHIDMLSRSVVCGNVACDTTKWTTCP